MSVEYLAEQLHREYRAAFKALHKGERSRHDHGWEHCHRKNYFLRRADRWLATERARVWAEWRAAYSPTIVLKDAAFESPEEQT